MSTTVKCWRLPKVFRFFFFFFKIHGRGYVRVSIQRGFVHARALRRHNRLDIRADGWCRYLFSRQDHYFFFINIELYIEIYSRSFVDYLLFTFCRVRLPAFASRQTAVRLLFSIEKDIGTRPRLSRLGKSKWEINK
jgi:hypothetical protein